MADQSPAPPSAPDDRFKAEMPTIPGVAGGAKPPSNAVAPLKIVGGLVAVLVVIVAAGSVLSHSRRNATQTVDNSSLDDTPTPDLGNPPPTPPLMRGIATVDRMAKPWSATTFDYRDGLSGEKVPALLLRLPGGSASQPAGYWAFALKSAYGNCQLELVSDLAKLRGEYGYAAARHPMVGNPCSHTVFDRDARGWRIQLYADGDGDGVRSDDRANGTDPPIGPSMRLKDRWDGVDLVHGAVIETAGEV